MFEFTMTRTEELQSAFSDMYKEANGFRPRHVDTSGWTEEDFFAEFEFLERTIKANDCQRKIAEHEAAHAFEQRMLKILACGAKDREMAMRWIHEAEGSNGDDEYLCYLVGVPYGHFRKQA